ncbi:MAG: MMPL family transporter, partial [Gemmataceae bacterium]|nr:MMPL family transporter [Gemmataceae bacterium]
MFRFLGRLASDHPWMILGTWLLVAVFMGATAPNWDRNSQDDDIRYLPASCASVRGYQLLEEAFPKDSYACNLVYVIERSDRPLDDLDKSLVNRIVGEIDSLRTGEPSLQIRSVASPRDPGIGKKLTSQDGFCQLVRVQLNCPYLAAQTRLTVDSTNARVQAVIQEIYPEMAARPTIYASGPAGIGRDLIDAGTNSLDKTTLATILLVVVILLFVYRSPLMVVIPLFTIALSVFVALKGLAMLTTIPGFKLANVSQIFAVVMLYGAGTDYCLFLISRYREELAEGRPIGSAVERSLGQVGHALAASAGTVIFGLGLMGTAEFVKIRSGGPAIALSLTVAFLASITLTPALLRLAGRWAFWPGKVPGRGYGRFHDLLASHGIETGERSGFWEKASRVISQRPGLWWMGAFLVLAPFAVLGCMTKASYRATAELRSSSPSIQGLQAIQRHFP